MGDFSSTDNDKWSCENMVRLSLTSYNVMKMKSTLFPFSLVTPFSRPSVERPKSVPRTLLARQLERGRATSGGVEGRSVGIIGSAKFEKSRTPLIVSYVQ